VVEQKKADLVVAGKQAELDEERAQLDLEEARHQLTLAERELTAYTGSDAERKKGLELKVKAARQLVKTRELQTTTTKARADAARTAARAALDAETARAKQLEGDIAECKMSAPRDGIVVFQTPPQWRPSMPILAAGEPVREGQKLMSLPDLSKMQLDTRVHESQIAFVRRDQEAAVRVDAFPDRPLAGKVVDIAQVGQVQGDVKVYPVKVSLPDNKLGLKPGMSAEVRIRVEPHRNVLRVPARAPVYAGPSPDCFVKVGEEVQERPVALGLGDNDFVEITNGLNEGDQVLRDPRAVARQLAGLPPK
jgi:RND family efflux transporter MFP subunit